jgi:hypothetical protein
MANCKHFLGKANASLTEAKHTRPGPVRRKHIERAKGFAAMALDSAKTGKEYKAVDAQLDRIEEIEKQII